MRRREGYTLVEAVVATALLGTLMIPIVRFFHASAAGVMKGTQRVKSDERLRKAMDSLQRDLGYMTELEMARDERVEFQVDGNRMPNYALEGDDDGDGIPNRVDPDRDNDAMGLPSVAGPAYFFGYDLWDQDDDGDGQVDARVRYRLDEGKLLREAIYNGPTPTPLTVWPNREVIAENVSKLKFTYLGSLAYLPASADCLPAGPPIGDGIVTEAEIKMAGCGIGNGNLLMDTQAELDAVSLISVELEVDDNRDGKVEGKAESEFILLLMPMKRRVS